MQTLDPPLASALAALTATVLMVYAGVGKCRSALLRCPCNPADVCGLIPMRQMARVATVTRSPYR
jgi:hypothetical protein